MALSKVGKNQVDQSASLTVDGDLTVDTNTLYVDSTNNRVGIGDNNPTQALSVGGHIKVDAGSTGYVQGPTGEMLVGEDGSGFYLGTGFGVNPSVPYYIGHPNVSSYNFRMGGTGGGNNVLAIDSSGSVTMPYQPSFSCYKNGIMTEASGDNRVENWTENHDQGGHLNNSTGRFTAPVSGKYFFAFSAMHSGLITGDLQFRIFRNGAAYQASNDTADGGNWDQCTVIAVVAMAANDYVEPYVYSNATTSREVVYTGIYSGWHGYLIG
jgi:hypothetical protein